MREAISGDHTRHNQMVRDWKPCVHFLQRPKITGQKTIGGVLHYLGENGKLYVAELFDRMFKVNKTSILKKVSTKTGLLIKTGR